MMMSGFAFERVSIAFTILLVHQSSSTSITFEPPELYPSCEVLEVPFQMVSFCLLCPLVIQAFSVPHIGRQCHGCRFAIRAKAHINDFKAVLRQS